MADEINVEKLTLWNIMTALTFDQAYKIGTTLTVMFCGVFWSGYQTAEYFHRQEAYKAQMFEAIAEMWEASNSGKKKPAIFKLPAPVINNGMPNISEQMRMSQAKIKLHRAIRAQNRIADNKWKLEESPEGHPIVKTEEGDFSLPKEEVTTEPIPANGSDEHISDTQSYLPFIMPGLILALIWALLIKAAKTPPAIKNS